MGKMTEALKRIEKQREAEKQALSKKAKVQPVLDGQGDKVRSESKGSEVVEKQRSAPWYSLEFVVKEVQERLKDLREKLKNRVYIAKATDESGIDPRVVTYFNSSTPVSEQYRILRTNIQSNKSTKTILVSSASYGEGKTLTAVNLAVALAQDLDKKVLLADCDLRGGNIHQLLNLNLNPGLSDVLINDVALEAVSYNSKINNLTVIPRGELPSNPSELLGSKRMRRLIEELRAQYDYIILDAPPIIQITDALILGAQTDGVIFVVQAQRTQAQTVRQAEELIKQAHAKIIGFVLTQVDYSIPDYYSYYHHYNQKTKEDR